MKNYSINWDTKSFRGTDETPFILFKLAEPGRAFWELFHQNCRFSGNKSFCTFIPEIVEIWDFPSNLLMAIYATIWGKILSMRCDERYYGIIKAPSIFYIKVKNPFHWNSNLFHANEAPRLLNSSRQSLVKLFSNTL